MSDLENQISIFKQKEQVILLDDTNARTSNLDDFFYSEKSIYIGTFSNLAYALPFVQHLYTGIINTS